MKQRQTRKGTKNPTFSTQEGSDDNSTGNGQKIRIKLAKQSRDKYVARISSYPLPSILQHSNATFRTTSRTLSTRHGPLSFLPRQHRGKRSLKRLQRQLSRPSHPRSYCFARFPLREHLLSFIRRVSRCDLINRIIAQETNATCSYLTSEASRESEREREREQFYPFPRIMKSSSAISSAPETPWQPSR